MALRKIELRAGQIKQVVREEAEGLFEDKAIPEPKVDMPKFPLTPIVATDRSKFISHRLGYFPDVRVKLTNGDIVMVGINHISDQECEITWKGAMEGVVIID